MQIVECRNLHVSSEALCSQFERKFTMAAATQSTPATQTIEPTREQINETAEEIRRDWTPAECQHRRQQALAAQQRLFCLAFTMAA
jgi:hypothetical protein